MAHFDSGQPSHHGEGQNRKSPPETDFQRLRREVFYGKPEFPGDVPHILDIEERRLTSGPIAQYCQRHNAESLRNQLAKDIPGEFFVDMGQPFVDFCGRVARVCEVRQVWEGQTRWLSPLMTPVHHSGSSASPESFSSRMRMIQHFEADAGLVIGRSFPQFDRGPQNSPTPPVLIEVLRNASEALRADRHDASVLLDALMILLSGRALRKFEELRKIEIDDWGADFELRQAARADFLCRILPQVKIVGIDIEGSALRSGVIPQTPRKPEQATMNFDVTCTETDLLKGTSMERVLPCGVTLGPGGHLLVVLDHERHMVK